MRHSSAAFKVGTVVIAGAVLASLAYTYLGSKMRSPGYDVRVGFPDAQGIADDADVRMAGKKIGVVTAVDLADRDNPASDGVFLDNGRWAIVRCRIARGYRVPDGSVWVIATGSLVGAPFIDIKPAVKRQSGYIAADGTAKVLGGKSPTFDTLMSDAQSSVGNLAGDLRGAIDSANKLMAKVGTTADSASSILSDPAFRDSLIATMQNVKAMSDRMVAVAERVDKLEASLEPSIRRMATDAEATSRQVRALPERVAPILEEVNALVRETRDTVTFLRGTLEDLDVAGTVGPSLQNVETVTASVAEASRRLTVIAANVEQISKDISAITSDPNFKPDVMATLAEVKSAAEQANVLLERLNKVSGKTTPGLNFKIESQASAIGTFGDGGEFRLDYDAFVPIGKDFVQVGVRSIGDGNYLNLEYGLKQGANALRAGLIGSKLGAGADYAASDKLSFTANLWDPNDVHLDLYARPKINNRFGAVLGFEDVLDDAMPTIGVTYRP